jgi:hypothetical protein
VSKKPKQELTVTIGSFVLTREPGNYGTSQTANPSAAARLKANANPAESQGSRQAAGSIPALTTA